MKFTCTCGNEHNLKDIPKEVAYNAVKGLVLRIFCRPCQTWHEFKLDNF